MKYKISKTAVLGPAYYLASFLFILPYSFHKHNPGIHFKLSPIRAVLAVFTWTSLNIAIFTLNSYKSLLPVLLITTCVYFFPLVYSRQKILQCLNTSYQLLLQIQNPPNITMPLILMFSPLCILCLIVLTTLIMSNDKASFFMQLDFLIFCNMSIVHSLCFSISLVFEDIRQQLHNYHEHCTSTLSLATLTKLQWQAYLLAQPISQAFGPFLTIYIMYTSLLTLNIFLSTMYDRIPFLILPILYHSWSMAILCFNSQNMNSQRAQLTNAIQKLMSCSKTTKEDCKKLTVMMEQAKLGNLYLSVLGFFQMDLPLLLTLANVIVTYLMILLEIV